VEVRYDLPHSGRIGASRKLSGIDGGISPLKSASVDLSKLMGFVGEVTACPDDCSLLAGQVTLREM
jgi:hypothetical protein